MAAVRFRQDRLACEKELKCCTLGVYRQDSQGVAQVVIIHRGYNEGRALRGVRGLGLVL